MSLTFDQYAEAAAKTAIYPSIVLIDGNPKSCSGITYPALGLCGEAGEVAEIVKKMLRDDYGFMTVERRANLLKELGDVLWYLSEVARQAGLSLSEVASANVQKLAARKAAGTIHCDGSDR